MLFFLDTMASYKERQAHATLVIKNYQQLNFRTTAEPSTKTDAQLEAAKKKSVTVVMIKVRKHQQEKVYKDSIKAGMRLKIWEALGQDRANVKHSKMINMFGKTL